MPGEKARRNFQAQAEKPLGTTLTGPFPNGQANTGSRLGTKNALLLCPIGEQFLLSSFREFLHDRYYFATVARFVHQAFLTRNEGATDESKSRFRILSAAAIQFALRKFCF